MSKEEYIKEIENGIKELDIKWLAIIYGMIKRAKEKDCNQQS